MTEAEIVEAVVVEEHTHDDGSVHDDHSHGDEDEGFSPQPVPMKIASDKVRLKDGSPRIMVTYASVNGQWTVFYDDDGAIAHAQRLLGLAHTPLPALPDDTPDEAVTEPI